MNIKSILIICFFISQTSHTLIEINVSEKELNNLIKITKIEQLRSKNLLFKRLITGSWGFLALQFFTAIYHNNERLVTFLCHCIGAYAVVTHRLWIQLNKESDFLENKQNIILAQLPKEFIAAINENSEIAITLTVP